PDYNGAGRGLVARGVAAFAAVERVMPAASLEDVVPAHALEVVVAGIVQDAVDVVRGRQWIRAAHDVVEVRAIDNADIDERVALGESSVLYSRRKIDENRLWRVSVVHDVHFELVELVADENVVTVASNV